jgi:hypothetical protein
MFVRALVPVVVVACLSACGSASNSQTDAGALDAALADGTVPDDALEPSPDGSRDEDGSPVDSPDGPSSEIPDTPPPACGPTCKAPSACTSGCNRCDCYAEPSWVCTAKACPGEGTGPCPTHLPLAGPVCGGRGTCVYESPCGGGKDIAKCDGLSWIVTKAPCPG